MKARAFLMLAATCSVVACGDDDPSGPGVTEGRLRLVPGVAAMPLVDIIVDGQLKAEDVPFAKTSNAIALPIGAHTVKVVAPNTAPSAGGTNVTVKANDTLTVVSTGTAAAPSVVVLGDTGATPVAGKGKLRVRHLASGTANIDVYRSQPDAQNFTKIMDPFPLDATSPFLESTPGNWTIRVTAKGTNTVLVERADIPVNALWVRTALILDQAGGGVRIALVGEQ